MARTWVTTSDNPFNYFKQYDQWVAYDENQCGYYTNSYVARIALTFSDMAPGEIDRAIEDACDEIVEMDLRYLSPVTGEEVCYIKVVEDE